MSILAGEDINLSMSFTGWKLIADTRFFLQMWHNYSNSNGSSVLTVRSTMLKIQPHCATFHENILISLWNFLPI